MCRRDDSLDELPVKGEGRRMKKEERGINRRGIEVGDKEKEKV
jgi:hypothetical protein